MSDTRKKDLVKVTIPVNVNLASGLIVGMFTGIGFHPLDRALYLRGTDKLKDRKHLFAPKYWQNPLSGLRTTIYQRILSGGIYFAMQGELNNHLYPMMKNEWQWGEILSKASVGFMSGSAAGFFSNANYAVKFFTITRKPDGRPLENAIEMWKQGGYKPFVNGIYAGVSRDASFGVFYEVLNLILDKHLVKKLQNKIPDENTKSKDTVYLLSRFFSAGVATIASSPLNYARNMQFKTPPHKQQPLIFDLWCDAWRESSKALKTSAKKNQSGEKTQPSKKLSVLFRLNFFRSKFMIGAGTTRAAGGIAASQLLSNKASEFIRGLDEEATQSARLENRQ